MSDIIAFDYESASVWLKPYNGYMKVYNLYSKTPRQGHATKLMEAVVEYADKVGCELFIIAKQYSNPRGLTDEQLKEFYGRFGFVHVPGGPDNIMVRPLK